MNSPVEVIHFSKHFYCRECGIRKLCIRNALDTRQKEILSSFAKKMHPFSKGETLFHAGDTLQNLFFLKSGSVKSFLTAENGDEQIIGFHYPGEILGLDNLTNNQYCSSTVFLENANVCKIDRNSFDLLINEIPQFQHEIIFRLTEETALLSELLFSINHLSAEQNLAAFILELSGRMELIGLSKTSLRLSMSRKDIANYIGLAAETVSRLFKRFERDRLIEIKNKNLLIIDFQGLMSRTHDCGICSKYLLYQKNLSTLV